MKMLRKRSLVALTAALSAVFLATVMAVPAQASTTATSDTFVSTTTTATADMKIDCSTITAEGIKYAKKNNLNICGVLSKGKSNTSVTPYNTVYDTCGSASISMSSSGYGNAHIWWHLHSTTGWILQYNLTVHYQGTAAAGNVGFSGVPVNIDAGDYTNPHTGSGYASAFLSGTAETVLYDCYIENPTTGATI
ncbi:hypothetical protein [Microbacterium rhizosphaerae]